MRVQCAIRSTVMTIAKTMTPIPAAVANATGVRAETVVLSPFHSASHTAHRSRGMGDSEHMSGQWCCRASSGP